MQDPAPWPSSPSRRTRAGTQSGWWSSSASASESTSGLCGCCVARSSAYSTKARRPNDASAPIIWIGPNSSGNSSTAGRLDLGRRPPPGTGQRPLAAPPHRGRHLSDDLGKALGGGAPGVLVREPIHGRFDQARAGFDGAVIEDECPTDLGRIAPR